MSQQTLAAVGFVGSVLVFAGTVWKWQTCFPVFYIQQSTQECLICWCLLWTSLRRHSSYNWGKWCRLSIPSKSTHPPIEAEQNKKTEREWERKRERNRPSIWLADYRGEAKRWLFVISLGCAENNLAETSFKKGREDVQMLTGHRAVRSVSTHRPSHWQHCNKNTANFLPLADNIRPGQCHTCLFQPHWPSTWTFCG